MPSQVAFGIGCGRIKKRKNDMLKKSGAYSYIYPNPVFISEDTGVLTYSNC
jgi:hypothetical protein